MRTEFVYSFLALGGVIPVTVNAADVQTISSDVLASPDGAKVTYAVGKLVPGKYIFTAQPTSKVYDVNIEIAGQKETFAAGSASPVSISFTLDKETNVELTLVSTDPGESGAGFTVAGAVVSLNYDFSAIKTTLANNAQTLATTISGYNYAAKEEDVEAANALKTKASSMEETYDSYKNLELYADKSTVQKEIDALGEKAAEAEAAYQNEQAYNAVNAQITAIKAKYNAAVTELEESLVGVSAYLLDAAKKELNDKINAEITKATQASYASYQAGTAVKDQSTNEALIPTESALNTIVNDYKGQANANSVAYNTLDSKVKTLQASLNAVTFADATVSEAFASDKKAAQDAIDAIKAKVEAAKNSAAQLTLDITTDETAAKNKVSVLAGKVTTANAEFNANKSTLETIAAVQKALNDAKTAVSKEVSKDGQYKSADYYEAYVADVQKDIDALTEAAGKAYKVDGTGTAQTYNSSLNTSSLETKISDYKTNAATAVEKYDALQTAISSYTKDLAATRAQVENMSIYTADGYDYETQLDLINKRINDIKKAIAAAQEKRGAEHWTAMAIIDADAAITSDIANLAASAQGDQNEYDATNLATNMTTLEGKISAFNAKAADASTFGADHAAYKAAEKIISDAYDAVKAAKGAVNVKDETVNYTSVAGTTDAEWKLDAVAHNGGNRNLSSGGKTAVEQWGNGNSTGVTLVQTIKNLSNGRYTVELYAFAAQGGTAGSEEFVHVFANGKTTPVKVAAGNPQSFGAILAAENGFNVYTIKDVEVTDGTLQMGLAKDKGGTQWHGIQIKSLTANTASLVQGWSQKISDLSAQQETLETGAGEVAAKVAANAKAQSDLAANITGLQNQIATFVDTYKIGDNANTTLGLKGKTDGAVTKEVSEIQAALVNLGTDNSAVVPSAVAPVDNTGKANKTTAGWKLKDINISGQNYQNQSSFGFQMVEQWANNNVSGTGVVLHQTLTSLPNGVYDLVLKAHAADQRAGNPNNGRTDIVEVYANGNTLPLTVSATSNVQTFTFNNVVVSDGTLDMGLRKLAAGTNWHAIQIESLTYHDNDQTSKYNKAETGYNILYNALAKQENDLEAAAPGIKTAVEENAATLTAANKAVADLQTAELATLKSLKNVTNAAAESDDATAKKTDPADFKVFETGLDADKTYTAKKAAIDTDITKLSTAITEAAAKEELASKWNNQSITVVTGKDDKENEITATYSISAITSAINALKKEAEDESANYEAYKALQDNNMPKLLPDTITVNDDYMGAGAKPYYQGLKDQYVADKADILKRMQADLNARKAVSTKNGFEQEIAALIAKIKVVNTNGSANLKKYKEQAAAATETQTLWNSTYTEIAATDHSTKVQEWLDELDAIQVTLTDATEAVEANYKAGQSVAKAQDFAVIQASINDVKARQNATYNEQITKDNLAAHESFNTAIASATKAYQDAVKARADYSSTNEELATTINSAAATLDEALYNCPTEIQTLTENENKAYAATVSPTIFEVGTYNADALTIEQDITTKLTAFKTAVDTAIKGYWTGKKSGYEAAVTAAENAIKDFSADAKKDAFKDVTDWIAKGDAAVAEMKLTEVDAAVAALTKLNDMLANDKDAAADRDITAQIDVAAKKFSDVKAYIEGVTNNIMAKAAELENLENAYANIADEKQLEKTFANHSTIKAALDGFIVAATNCENNVKAAVDADNANTTAYEEMTAAIAPVEAKLNEAKAKVDGYKYETSFATNETTLAGLKTAADNYKAAGSAVANKATFLTNVNSLSSAIDATLTTAFGTEKSSLSADITELKNQYNAYVAANGLDEKATAFKSDIDELEASVSTASIKDLDEPTDGIQYDEILAATDALIKLQNDIADKETELLAANANGANANVLADFTNQLNGLEATASLEGYDNWVGQQMLGGKTLQEQITALKAQIADLKSAIEAEDNISFYKDKYQEQIDAVKTALEPVVAEITAKDAQFKANAEAYTTLTAQIEALQGKIDAAKAKVGAYEFAADYYGYYIESYDYYGVLSGGAQYLLNNIKADVEALNGAKNAQSYVLSSTNIDYNVQNYLDRSAYTELYNQRDALSNALTDAIDAKYEGQKYSNALWARLIAEKNGIAGEIAALGDAISYSWSLTDLNGDPKSRTSDTDYAAQMQTVADIKAGIATLSTAVDNLGLLGDANEDGRVNVLDYQKVANMILDPKLQPADGTDLFVNIDINQSEVIEVGDLTAIVNYILNGDWQGYAAARAFGMDASESLTMNTSTLNGKQRIAIDLNNANEYTAFQMDIVLPEGMSIVGTSLTDRAGQSHKLYSRTQLDGSIRLLASSVKGESFSGNQGAVLYIDVEGAGNIEVLNILFADLQNGTRAFNLASSEATGIDTVGTFASLKQQVYDLGGRLMNGLKKGVNIIRQADGSTQKVMK